MAQSVYFIKSSPAIDGKQYAYHAGQSGQIEDSLAEKFIEQGFAIPISKIIPRTTPARDDLIYYGFFTVEKLLAFKPEQIAEVVGITKQKAQEAIKHVQKGGKQS